VWRTRSRGSGLPSLPGYWRRPGGTLFPFLLLERIRTPSSSLRVRISVSVLVRAHDYVHPSFSLQIRKYERMTELTIASEPLLDYSKVI